MRDDVCAACEPFPIRDRLAGSLFQEGDDFQEGTIYVSFFQLALPNHKDFPALFAQF